MSRSKGHAKGHLGKAGATEVGKYALEAEREREKYPGSSLFPPSNLLPVSAPVKAPRKPADTGGRPPRMERGGGGGALWGAAQMAPCPASHRRTPEVLERS